MRGRAARPTSPPVLKIASRLLAAVPIALTILPMWRTARGWVRIWDFPRVQIATLGLAALAGMLARRRPRPADRALTAALLTALVYQGARIAPYTPIYRRQVPTASEPNPDRRIRLLMCNVLQKNRRSDLVLQAAEEASADLVCLVETDSWWERAMKPLEQDYKWVHACALDNTYGMILYSRLPIISCDTRFLVRPGVPSMRATVRLRSGDEVIVHAVHPSPPLPNQPTYGRDAELVLTGREIHDHGRPAIVIGDLNDVAWSYTTRLFQRVSHTIDPRVGRGMFNTFHAGNWLARYPLDHVFHTREFTVHELRRLGPVGSDHFPIVVELAYTPSRRHDIEKPSPTPADRETAEEILAEEADEGEKGWDPGPESDKRP